MSTFPLVTINIPAYNQEKYIGRAIESCLKQDYSNIEIIVSDDCSTDKTFAIAKTYESDKVKVCQTVKNLGRIANYRHTLYNLSSGDWVVNLDGDDYYDDPTFIREAVAFIQTDPEIVLYAAGSKVLHEDTGQIELSVMGLEKEVVCMPGTTYVLGYPGLNATQHFSVLYNRRLAMETGFYLLDSLGTDTDSICRLALKGKVLVHRKYVGVWTHHERNASYSLTMQDVSKEINMLHHIADDLRKHVPPPVAEKWLQERVAEKKRFAVNLCLSKLPNKEALRLYLEHVKFDFFYFKEGLKLLLRFLHLR